MRTLHCKCGALIYVDDADYTAVATIGCYCQPDSNVWMCGFRSMSIATFIMGESELHYTWDHIDGNKHNNQRSNFRKWRATITINGAWKGLGYYDTPEPTFLLGVLPKELEWDHADRNVHNNRRSNLRKATHQQNTANRGVPINNTSGYKGVCWSNEGQKWRAGIKVRGKTHHLGLFDNVEDAAARYNRAAKHYFGDFACLNTICAESKSALKDADTFSSASSSKDDDNK